jgi:hypothetical protein
MEMSALVIFPRKLIEEFPKIGRCLFKRKKMGGKVR